MRVALIVITGCLFWDMTHSRPADPREGDEDTVEDGSDGLKRVIVPADGRAEIRREIGAS